MQSFRRLTAAPAIRSLLARPRTVSSRQFVRRSTQASGHSHGGRSSDLPWIIGAIAFTVPATFYLLSSSSKPAHHSPAQHGHGHATEAEDSEAANTTSEEEEDSSPEEAEPAKQPDSTDSKNQATEESTSNDQASDVTEEIGEKVGEVTGEVKEKVDEHTGGKASKEDETKDDGNQVGERERKTGSDEGKESVVEKKAVKKEKPGKETKSQALERLNREKPNKKPSDIDPPAAGMKDVTSANMQSGKQEGISNGDTWHPVLHSERGQAISKKSEGAHQTAKLKGTVDPFRPANYDATKK